MRHPIVALSALFLAACSTSGSEGSATTSGTATGSGSGSTTSSGGASCVGGTLTATFADVSTGGNANAAAFAATLANGAFAGEVVRITGASATGSPTRQILVDLGTTPTVGQTFQLTPGFPLPGSQQAAVFYSQGAPATQCWTAESGSLQINAIDSCSISFTVSNATMAAGDEACGSATNGAQGTFTLNAVGTKVTLPCGTLDATFSTGGSGGNAVTSALSIDGPLATDMAYFDLNAASTQATAPFERGVELTVFAPLVMGQTYPLTSAASIATPGSATAFYFQASTDGAPDQCWVASGGSLTLTSLSGCLLSLTVTGATMAPAASTNASGECQSGNNASGTFTMDVVGTGDELTGP